MNIFITRKIGPAASEAFRAKGWNVDTFSKDRAPSPKELVSCLKKKPYDAVLTLLTDRIDATVMDAAPSVKIFANYAIGFDNFDVAEGKKRGVAMTNTPGDTFAFTIAEHAIALMFGLTTRMVEADNFVRKGKYKGWDPMLLVGTDLKGKTIGIVGAGHIGVLVAERLFKGFGAKILYYDIKRSEALEQAGMATFVPVLEDLLKQSDIVTLHAPLMEATRHMINADRLKLMKPTAFLINTARGPLVDEMALVEALKKGFIRGAAMDVYEHEPKLAKGLAKLPNVILTPHIASARESARAEMTRLAVTNIIEVLEGRAPLNPVY
jgi:glyoxylate reductase